MIVRVLVGVLVAGALLAAATPAVHAARLDHGRQVGATAAGRLGDAVRALVADSDPTLPGLPGATARVTLRLPTPALATPRVSLALVEAGANTTTPGVATIAVRVAGTTHRTPLPVPLDVPGDRLVVRPGSRITLHLRYVSLSDGPTVRVSSLPPRGSK